jgi:hypothetical protein
MEGGVKTIKMSMADFKKEHHELLDVLRNPTKEKLEREYAKQLAELNKTLSGSGIEEPPADLMMPEKLYLKKAKAKAKAAGYDPKMLMLADDGKHKLVYDGVKFGALGYGDHIIYKYLEKLGEVEKGLASKKRRVFRKSHGAMNDSGKMSANQLALAVIW